MTVRSLALAACVLAVYGCSSRDNPAETAPAAEPAATAAAPAPTEAPAPTGTEIMALQKTDLAPGNGVEIKSGQTALVHYTGWLYDAKAADHKGAKFDSSRDRNEPFEFRLGAGQVIQGWDQGVAGMKVGGRRTLTIPPGLGYGARGAG